MKSKQWRSGWRWGETLENFSKGQLEAIGAVAMTYNDAASALYDMFESCLTFPGDKYEITSRINGLDGIAQIIQIAIETLPLEDQARKEISAAVAQFSQLKVYRDVVVHARITDVPTAYAVRPDRKGGRSYTILTEKAVKTLWQHINAIRSELGEWATVISHARQLRYGPVKTDRHKEQLEEGLRVATAQARSHRTRRQSLPPLPTVPDEEEYRAQQRGRNSATEPRHEH
ncbi:MAG TPA: hypothetical protein VEU06_05155 [Micropepsaceae bacterium]|nr:hypothetical protein [Micropepsaceae bacterium]